MYACPACMPVAGGQKALAFLELELWMVVNCDEGAGNEHRSSAGAGAFNC